jgi:hypothetical protein
VGQEIYIYTKDGVSVCTGHRIARIYTGPLSDNIPNLRQYLKDIFGYLTYRGNRLLTRDVATIPELEGMDNLNHFFFKIILGILSSEPKSNGWSLSVTFSRQLLNLANNVLNGVNTDNIFDSELIWQNDFDEIVVSDALVLLFMNAIHRARSMATKFDENGILCLVI